ncbi:MAG: hypothetical protein WC780_18825 [Lentimicrobiaceae bacterium]|jgi:hypothetical protein
MKKNLLNNISKTVSEHGASIPALSLFLKTLIMVFLIVLTSVSLNAQGIIELKSYLEKTKTSPDPALVSKAKHLESLVTELQPTVYLSNSIVTGNTKAKCAEVKASAIDQLSSDNSLFNDIELITIRLESPADMGFVLDLSKLNGFTKLKYIYFLCEFDGDAKELQKLFIPTAGITVLYMVSIPS